MRVLALLLSLFAAPICARPLAAAPLPTPSQIHVTLGADLQHYVISWVTFEDSPTSSMVQYGSDPLSLTRSAQATSTIFTNACNTSRNMHDVEIAVDASATSVYYRVSSGGVLWSAVQMLSVLQLEQPDFAFAVVGDMGINCQQTSVPQLIADTVAGRHQMLIHYGDIAYNLDDQCGAVGDLYMNAVAPFAAQMPVVMGVGNHETSNDDGVTKYTYIDFLQRYRGQQSLAAAARSPSIRYLSFNIGLVHVAMVDTDAYIYAPVFPLLAPQYAWLEQDLKAVNRSATPWLILIGHRGMYCDSTGSPECDGEAATLRNGLNGSYALEPLMLQYGVDLYFAGHTHRYQRNWPAARGALVQLDYNDPRAPVHVQSGIGGVDGGDTFPPETRPFTAFRDEQLNIGYGRVTVHNATHLTFAQHYAVNGSVIDTFTIAQHAHGPFPGF